MTNRPPVLEVNDLEIEYRARDRQSRALDGVRLAVSAGEVVGIVGESGSGKSTLGMAAGRLLPSSAHRIGGDLRVEGTSVFEADDRAIRGLRRDVLGFVFQNPMTALDPTMRVEHQLASVTPPNGSIDDLLRGVGLGDTRRVRAAYPHQLSGGMAQRVAIAMAIARKPRLIVADEATASLDASSRTQILELLVSLPAAIGAAVLLLSHDLAAVEGFTDRVVVMYAGRAVEVGSSRLVFARPAHPYTAALLAAEPAAAAMGERLQPIPGMHPILTDRERDCAFASRCAWTIDRCRVERPETRSVDERVVLCHRSEEVVASHGTPPRLPAPAELMT